MTVSKTIFSNSQNYSHFQMPATFTSVSEAFALQMISVFARSWVLVILYRPQCNSWKCQKHQKSQKFLRNISVLKVNGFSVFIFSRPKNNSDHFQPISCQYLSSESEVVTLSLVQTPRNPHTYSEKHIHTQHRHTHKHTQTYRDTYCIIQEFVRTFQKMLHDLYQ